MLIGLDGSRAFIKNRTGIEEYSYQVIKGLRDKLDEHLVFLYVRSGQKIDFDLPKNWTVKTIRWPRFWTQIGLSLEMLLRPVDVLFVPAHTVPCVHPKKTIVTIHGLEYEFCPGAYSFWERLYMRSTIKKSCQWASSIIAVSENTKKDLMKLYNVDEKKMQVIYEGCMENDKFPMTRLDSQDDPLVDARRANDNSNPNDKFQILNTKYDIQNTKYLLFIGRIEERKNVVSIVNAFEILKERYKISHKLILAGKPGFGYEKIKDRIENSNCAKDVIELGYVSETEKWELLKKADVFVFPSLYEGFGLPILEAQNAGVPVVASTVSSIPEVTTCCHPELVSGSQENLEMLKQVQHDSSSALLVNPNNAEDIADAIQKILSDENLKDNLTKKGHENVQRFSWEKCAREVGKILN